MKRLSKGKVYLVGAGPGDPKLITVRGLEAIRKADVVVYDRLANPQLLRHMKPGAERIYVGKLPDRHTLRQEVISQMLVDLALQGKVVTRLKGGDPTVFGRAGEEAELLAEHGIEFEMVPGITSAVAVPAYAGIPITHRDFTSSVAIVTGHECPKKTGSNINWAKLSTATGTLIFLMGVSNIGAIRDVLIENGKPADTPVALIRWGTRADQQTLTGTLATIEDQVRASHFQSPAVIIVGEVVKLREKLSWYEKKPLFGKRVLITRSGSQSGELANLIDELGGEPVEFPVIRMQPPSRPETVQALDNALRSLAKYDWIVFTSVNGVEYFFRRMKELKVDVRTMHRARIAAVGPKTAEALLDRGLVADMPPGQYTAEKLFEFLAPDLKPGQNALLPRADIAAKQLPNRLREAGLNVTEVDVYETVLCADNGRELLDMLQKKEIHIITFTSSSTVKNLLTLLSQLGAENPAQLLEGAEIACIGPVTAQTAEQSGLKVHYTAKEATVASLIEEIASRNASKHEA